MTEEEFVQDKLEKTGVNILLGNPNGVSQLLGVSVVLPILKELRRVGIRTADQIPDNLPSTNLTNADRTLITKWYEERKQQYKADYYLAQNPKDTRFLPNAGWWRDMDSKMLNDV